MPEKIYIRQHVNYLKQKAAQMFQVSMDKCHLGHVLLLGLLDKPDTLNQIDAATDERETNQSVATRIMRLASAMNKFGLKPGDPVVVMGFNHMDICIPFYACHMNGHSICAMDPAVPPGDLTALFPTLKPKMVICQKSCVDKMKDAYKLNNMEGEIITFDDKTNDMETFIQKHNGTEVGYRPAEFDHASIDAWLILTSGTTGLPKVVMVPYKTLLNAICCWWEMYNEPIDKTLSMSTIQWLSALMFFVSGPLRCYTRLQSSKNLTPLYLNEIIKKYRPNVTAWTPFLVQQFLIAAENGCDLTSFQCIMVAGSAMEKPLLERFRKVCPARMLLTYGMTELMVPVFEFNETTPDNSTGYPLEKYEYKLVADDGKTIYESYKYGELWIKGNDFFRGYLNNPEETNQKLTEDGWFRTGDIFYRDKMDYFYFVERKTLLIRRYHSGGYHWVAPLKLEEVIKTHPGVLDACVVGIPDVQNMELPVGIIIRRNGDQVDPEDIFEMLNRALPETKQMDGGLFFVDSFPITPSGKINRSNLREMAINSPRILPNKLIK